MRIRNPADPYYSLTSFEKRNFIRNIKAVRLFGRKDVDFVKRNSFINIFLVSFEHRTPVVITADTTVLVLLFLAVLRWKKYSRKIGMKNW